MKMKLSKAQKNVIQEMRTGRKLFWSYATQRYSISTILDGRSTVNIITARTLRIFGLVTPKDINLSSQELVLTELGKTIEL